MDTIHINNNINNINNINDTKDNLKNDTKDNLKYDTKDSLKNDIDYIDEILNETLKCDVCKDLLNEPKTLLCQHTFCSSCISSLKECPMCRLKLYLPSKNNDIFTNLIGLFYGSEKVEELKNKNKKEQIEKELLPKLLAEMSTNLNNTIKDSKSNSNNSNNSNNLIVNEPNIINNLNNQPHNYPSLNIFGFNIEVNTIIKFVETLFFIYYSVNFIKTLKSGNFNTMKLLLNFIIIIQSFYTLFFKSNFIMTEYF